MPTPSQLPPFLASALGNAVVEDLKRAAAQSGDQGNGSLSSPVNETAETQRLEADLLPNDDSNAPSTLSVLRSDDAQTYRLRLRTYTDGSIPIIDEDGGQTAEPTLLVPPLNFDMICADSSRQPSVGRGRRSGGGAIYRSGFPNERNYPFLATLKLRSVIYLAADDVRPNLQRYIDESRGHIRLLHFPLNVNKEPFAEMDRAIVAQALSAILDQRNWPLLVHCNKGKYRVGVITALIRRLQGWSMTSIYEEYARFAGHDRVADEEFIDMFPIHTVTFSPDVAPNWLRI